MIRFKSINVVNIFSFYFKLFVDAVCSDRYHCSHSAGVHSVQIPWSYNFSKFCNEGIV